MKRVPTKKKNGKKVPKIKDERTEEIKHYIGIVAEDFQHRVSAIAEQFLGLNEKLDEHSKKLDSHTEMIGRLMIDVEDIKVNMREKVNREEFNKLESRLVTLEAIVFSGKSKLSKKQTTQR